MQRIWLWLAAALLGLAVAPVAMADPAPLAAYGTLPSLEDMALSPSGRLLALVVVGKDEQRTIIVQDLAAKTIVTGVKVGDRKLRGLMWAGDGHLLLIGSAATRTIDLLADTREWFMATDFNLATRRLAPLLGDVDLSLNSIAAEPVVRMIAGKPIVFVLGYYWGAHSTDLGGAVERSGQLALFRVDLDTDRSTLVAADRVGATDYLVGADGQLLAESAYDATAKRWDLLVMHGGVWRLAKTQSAPIEAPSLLGLGRDGRSILVRGLGDDIEALREISPDGASVSDPLPGPWQGGQVRDPASHRLIGMAALVGDSIGYYFYDPADDRRWRGIAAAFPGRRIALVSASDDRQRLLVHVDSPTEGPGYALVDLGSHSAQWLGPEYPSLQPADISSVTSISFKAADGLDLHGYLTLPHGRDPKGLPLVVFPHGGPAARDEPGFDWWAQAMASRGYAVLQVNYRGSDGFGRDFLKAGFGEWGRKMQTDLSDGVRYLAAQGAIDPKRVCIVGGSYGGYAALAGATLESGVYRCAVSVAGISDLARFIGWSKERTDSAVERYWTRYMGATGLSDPHLKDISPVDHVTAATPPILLIHGKDDTVVPFEQSQMMLDALRKAGRPADLVTLKSEDHWLSRGETRLEMLQATIDFLERNNPPS